MSQEALWDRVRMAWRMLSGRANHHVEPGRPRESRPPSPAFDDADAAEIAAEGFAEEALPWLDAVYRLSLRLTRGDPDASEDLVQETFLRAHRFWHTYERGTNARSWLFTICRNTFLNQKDLARARRERPAADFDADVEALSAVPVLGEPPIDPESHFFGRLIDEEVVRAIDELPEEYRETLVLSDLGDLTYAEVAGVLGVPIGTVRSRLFRARRMLQDRLRELAVVAGYVQESEK